MEDPEVMEWERSLLGACALVPELFERVHVAREVGSTQDLARALCKGKPGVIVGALRQVAGRGRLGRVWSDDSARGLALTFVVDAAGRDAGVLSLAAGLASLRACQGFLGASQGLGLKWPNDVVERVSGKKLSGVLIEGSDSLYYIGIGINVGQLPGDLPLEVTGSATSLAMLGGSPTRLRVGEALVVEVARALELTAAQVAGEWSRFDVLTGTYRTFESDGRQLAGLVESLDPLGEIRLRTASGGVICLAARSSTLVKTS